MVEADDRSVRKPLKRNVDREKYNIEDTRLKGIWSTDTMDVLSRDKNMAKYAGFHFIICIQ